MEYPLVKAATETLVAAGITSFQLLAASYDPATFGNAEAVFDVGVSLLKFTRDRAEHFLSLASRAAPEQFYPLHDVEVGMAWRPLDEVLAPKSVETLGDVVARIAPRIRELQALFSDEK